MRVFRLDPSDEVENEDLNHRFEAALGSAEKLAAELFGGRRYFVFGERDN